MATRPIFFTTARHVLTQLTTADTTLTGATNPVDILPTGTTTRVDRIELRAAVTTTAGMIRIGIHDGTNLRMIREIPVVAAVPSGTVSAWGSVVFFNGGLIVPSTHKIVAWIYNSETVNVHVIGASA